MLDALKFVMGGLSTMNAVPVLKHFRIENGMVRSFNGVVALGAPIAIDLTCTPEGKAFYRAIENCEDVAAMSMTPAGRLSVRSGKFRVVVNCLNEVPPEIVPEGEQIVSLENVPLVETLRVLAPFRAKEPTSGKTFAMTSLIRNGCMYVTNNIAALQKWLGPHGWMLPEFSIPDAAIVELLRIKENPISVRFAEKSATFHYSGDRWLRTSLNIEVWPNVDGTLDIADQLNVSAFKLDPEFWTMLAKLKTFTGKSRRIYLGNEKARTDDDDESSHASVDLPGMTIQCSFDLHQLLALKDIAEAINFAAFPKACAIVGKDIRGAIMGMRL